jgi:alpha-mannosidase
MVQGVPDDNKNLSEKAKDQSPTIEAVEEVTQPAEPIVLDETHNKPSADEVKPASVKQTPEPPQPKPVAGTLYLLSYLLWEREGIATFEVTRAHLLDTITTLIEHLKTSANEDEQLKHVILGGQTVLIEDIAAVRSDLLALLVIYNAGGRFGIGPWYIQVDSRLVSGESLIRNLLLGRTDVSRHGIDLMDSAFMPFAIEHSAQLPQILAGFDISSVLITSPEAVMSLPFRWVAPDGSHVMVINHHHTDDVGKAIEDQEYSQPDGPFLWLNAIDSDTELVAPSVEDDVKVPVLQNTLSDYMSALRKGLPDGLRPALKGELQLLGPGYQAGRFSTRLYLKQANTRLQSLLTHQTEPWLAIALTDGKPKSPDNLRALLDHSWRELMKNQSRNNLTGCSHDTVTQETEIRNQRILDVTQRIQDVSLDALPGTLTRITSPEQQSTSRVETYIGVWNSHNFSIEQIVEMNLILPDGIYPKTLLDDKGEEISYSWEIDETDSEYACKIGFRAQVDTVGYSVYTLKLSDQKPDSHHDIVTNKGKVIGNVSGETLLVEKGQLVWSRLGQRIPDFLSFYDGGDAGDTYNYRKPQPDVVVRAGMTDMVSVESTATYERLVFRKRMRIAPDLKDDLSRSRGLSLLDITTTATFYDNIPGIYFRTIFTNKAKDHRLRAHFRTNLNPDIGFLNKTCRIS